MPIPSPSQGGLYDAGSLARMLSFGKWRVKPGFKNLPTAIWYGRTIKKVIINDRGLVLDLGRRELKFDGKLTDYRYEPEAGRLRIWSAPYPGAKPVLRVEFVHATP